MNKQSETEFLTPRHLFVAYARMLASREMFPAIRDYHEKKFRILAELFDVELVDGDGISDLAHCYSRLSFYHPCGGVVMGSNGVDCLVGFLPAIRRLRRNAADMRLTYSQLAVEWLIKNFPGIESKRVHVSRLKEFAISPTPPDSVEECIKATEGDDV